jgi:RimJ/RimL family protein N-acetyltransferase
LNPILLDFPDSFDTERLTVRAPRPGDGPKVVEAIEESLDELRPWMLWAAKVETLEESEARLRRAAAKWLTREDLLMHLYLKGADTFVGSSGLHGIDWDTGKCEVGYWLRTKFTGQGYITEAVNGITRFAFAHLKANRVEIRCDAKNVRSAAVARRCGFLLEGILRHEDRRVDGHLSDTLVFSKISLDEFHRYDE